MGTVNNLEHFQFGPAATFDPSRFERADLGIALEPSFQIARGERILVMGSCFAVRVAEALSRAGPRRERRRPGPQVQRLRRSAGAALVPRGRASARRRSCARPTAAGSNPHRHPRASRARVRRCSHAHLAAQRAAAELVRHCDVVVLTYGLIEAWFRPRMRRLQPTRRPVSSLRAGRSASSCGQTTQAQNTGGDVLELVRLVARGESARALRASVSPCRSRPLFCGPDVLVFELRQQGDAAFGAARGDRGAEERGCEHRLTSRATRSSRSRRGATRPGARSSPTASPDGRHVRGFVARAIMSAFLRAYVGEDARLGAQPAIAPVREASTESCGTPP